MQQISPVAHLPLVLGVVRKRNVAALIETFCPPHPAHILSCGRGVAHELRIAEPTICDDHRRWQCHTASAEGCHPSIQDALYPVQFVPTRSSRPRGIGPANGKVDGHHQFAIADDHDE
jgi:hypothetical protein